jgi:hypothetical protein
MPVNGRGQVQPYGSTCIAMICQVCRVTEFFGISQYCAEGEFRLQLVAVGQVISNQVRTEKASDAVFG